MSQNDFIVKLQLEAEAAGLTKEVTRSTAVVKDYGSEVAGVGKTALATSADLLELSTSSSDIKNNLDDVGNAAQSSADELDGLTAILDNLRKGSKRADDILDDLSTTSNELDDELSDLGITSDDLDAEFNDLEKSSDDVGRSFEKSGGFSKSLKKGITLLGAAAVVALGSIALIAKSTFDAAEELKELQEGKKSLEDLSESALELNQTLSTLEIDRLIAVNEQWDNQKSKIAQVGHTFTSALTPLIHGALNEVNDLTSGFINWGTSSDKVKDAVIVGLGFVIDQVDNIKKGAKLLELGWLELKESGVDVFVSWGETGAKFVDVTIGGITRAFGDASVTISDWVISASEVLENVPFFKGSSEGLRQYGDDLKNSGEILKSYRFTLESLKESQADLTAKIAETKNEIADIGNESGLDKAKDLYAGWEISLEEVSKASSKTRAELVALNKDTKKGTSTTKKNTTATKKLKDTTVKLTQADKDLAKQQAQNIEFLKDQDLHLQRLNVGLVNERFELFKLSDGYLSLNPKQQKQAEIKERQIIAQEKKNKLDKAFSDVQKELIHDTQYYNILQTDGEEKALLWAYTIEYGTEARAKEIIKLEEKAKLQQQEMDLYKKGEDAIFDYIKTGVDGFDELDESIEKIAGSINKLFSKDGDFGDVFDSLGDLLNDVDDLFVKDGGLGGAIANYQTASGLAGALGGGKDTQTASGIGAVAAPLLGLPPSIGAAIAVGIQKVFGIGQSPGEATLNQGFVNTNDQFRYQDQDFSRDSIFGEFGLNAAGTYKPGRVENYIPKLQDLLDATAQSDALFAGITTSEDRNRIQNALSNKTQDGFDLESFTEDRLKIIVENLDKSLSPLVDTNGSLEQMYQRIDEINHAAIAFVPAFEDLGLNLGNTTAQMTANALLLSDAAGGADRLVASNANYFEQLFTQEEKQAYLHDRAIEQRKELNEQLGLSGSAQITSASGLKLYIDSLKTSNELLTDAGKENLLAAYDAVDAYAFLRDEQKAIDDAREKDEKDRADKKLKEEQDRAAAELKIIQDRNIAEQKARDDLNNALLSGHEKYVRELQNTHERENDIRKSAVKAINDHAQKYNLFGDAVLDTTEELDNYIFTRAFNRGSLSDARKQELNDAYNLIDAVTDLRDIDQKWADEKAQTLQEEADRELALADEKERQLLEEFNNEVLLAEKKKQADEEALARAEELAFVTAALNEIGFKDVNEGILELTNGLAGATTLSKQYFDLAFEDEEKGLISRGKAAQAIQSVADELGLALNELDEISELRSVLDSENALGNNSNVVSILGVMTEIQKLDQAGITGSDALTAVPDNLRDIFAGVQDLQTPYQELQTDLETTTDSFTATGHATVTALTDIEDKLTNIVNIPFPDYINKSNGVAGESTDKITTALEKQIQESNARLDSLKAEMGANSTASNNIANVIEISNRRAQRAEEELKQFQLEARNREIETNRLLADLVAKP